MSRYLFLFKYLTLVGFLLQPVSRLSAEIIHVERSQYLDLYVEEVGEQRCLSFSDNNEQSCVFLNHPDYLVWDYSRGLFASFAFLDNPKRALIIGLGGGVIPRAIQRLYPEVTIDVVELDPAMLTVAEAYFDFEQTSSMLTHVSDGRVFVKRAVRSGRRYDLVVLDAFGLDWTPEHMMTEEFLMEVKVLLGSKGIFVSHSLASNDLKDNLFVTYQQVFGDFYYMSTSGCCPLIFARAGEYPSKQQLFSKLPELILPMQSLHISIDDYLARLTRKVDWNENARVLTDGYSPGNLLMHQGP